MGRCLRPLLVALLLGACSGGTEDDRGLPPETVHVDEPVTGALSGAEDGMPSVRIHQLTAPLSGRFQVALRSVGRVQAADCAEAESCSCDPGNCCNTSTDGACSVETVFVDVGAERFIAISTAEPTASEYSFVVTGPLSE